MVEEKLEEHSSGLRDKNMVKKLEHKDLLKAGVHFGHLTRKWNPKMSEYIFMENNGIHIIDLHKTIECAYTAAASLQNIAKSGRKIMFVATKKQAKTYVSEKAKELNINLEKEVKKEGSRQICTHLKHVISNKWKGTKILNKLPHLLANI